MGSRWRSTGEPDTGPAAELDLVANEHQRARAFRNARRHTWLVKAMRLLLPAFALASAGVYGVSLYATSKLKGAKIAVSSTRIDPVNLTMEDPRYDGFAKDGSSYKVHAKTAVTDLKMQKPVRLNLIDGVLLQTSGVVTKLTAKWGTYDQKKDLLELYERIDIAASDGTKAKLSRATVWAKENRIASDQPVWAEMSTGTIRAKAMELFGKTRKANFRDGVEVTLKGNARGGREDRETAARPARSPLPGLQMNAGQPVVVTSRTLAVDDNAHTALFRQTVVARQGEAQLQAPELDVLYEGSARPPGQSTEAGATRKQDAAAADSRLKKILARGGVVLTNRDTRAVGATLDYDASTEQALLSGKVVLSQPPDRTITAETAMFDQKSDSALLTGQVVVTQAANVLRSERLDIDRKAGTARLSSPAIAGKGAGRISTVLHQRAAGKTTEKKATAKKADTRQSEPLGGLLGGGFKSNPDAPIEIEAATLDILDRQHRAIYVGKVVAKQGGLLVQTEELTAHYVGEMGLAGDQASASDRKGSVADLKLIEARKGVVITGSEGQKAKGEWADFDVKANTATIGGRVAITQPATGATPDKQQAMLLPDGMRFVVNLTTGEYRTEMEPGTPVKTVGPQVSGAFATSVVTSPKESDGSVPFCPKGAVCRANRPQLVIYPNQLQKSRASASGVSSGSAGGTATKASRKVRKPAKDRQSQETLPWSATTTTPSTR